MDHCYQLCFEHNKQHIREFCSVISFVFYCPLLGLHYFIKHVCLAVIASLDVVLCVYVHMCGYFFFFLLFFLLERERERECVCVCGCVCVYNCIMLGSILGFCC